MSSRPCRHTLLHFRHIERHNHEEPVCVVCVYVCMCVRMCMIVKIRPSHPASFSLYRATWSRRTCVYGVCVCVCMYVCMHVCVCVCVRLGRHSLLHFRYIERHSHEESEYVYVYVYTYVFVTVLPSHFRRINTRACVHVCVYGYIRSMCVCVCVEGIYVYV